jgi:hypothetical protein
MLETLNPATAADAVRAEPRAQRTYSPEHRRRLAEAAAVFSDALQGNTPRGLRGKAVMQEAMSRSDFPILLGQIIDRQLLARYQALPPVWQRFARRTTVNDFRPHTLIDVLGGQAGLSLVPELTEYPARAIKEATSSFTVQKYGDRFALSWEMIVNDNLGQFVDLPDRLATAARETEDRVAAALVASPTGPNAALFNANAVRGPGWDPAVSATANTSSNLLTGNPALSSTSLQTALTAMSQRRDVDGRPISIPTAILMVPPALEIPARQILNATQVITQVGTGLQPGSQQVFAENFLRNIVTLVVNPWLPIVDTSANVNTTWYLLPDPGNPRPAVTVAFLRGYETPDLRVSADGGNRVGGGAVPASEGSFEVDDVQYRVRHVLGGGTIDAIASAASNGTGT